MMSYSSCVIVNLRYDTGKLENGGKLQPGFTCYMLYCSVSVLRLKLINTFHSAMFQSSTYLYLRNLFVLNCFCRFVCFWVCKVFSWPFCID